jgi:hypothetical protein
MRQDKVIQARLLRAKARFAAGLRGAAHQGKVVALLWCHVKAFFDALTPVWSDLQAILLLDPSNREVRELLPPPGGKMPTRTGRVSQLPLLDALPCCRPSQLSSIQCLDSRVFRMRYGAR